MSVAAAILFQLAGMCFFGAFVSKQERFGFKISALYLVAAVLHTVASITTWAHLTTR